MISNNAKYVLPPSGVRGEIGNISMSSSNDNQTLVLEGQADLVDKNVNGKRKKGIDDYELLNVIGKGSFGKVRKIER